MRIRVFTIGSKPVPGQPAKGLVRLSSAIALAASLLFPALSSAQETVYIGSSSGGKPAVEINLNALGNGDEPAAPALKTKPVEVKPLQSIVLAKPKMAVEVKPAAKPAKSTAVAKAAPAPQQKAAPVVSSPPPTALKATPVPKAKAKSEANVPQTPPAPKIEPAEDADKKPVEMASRSPEKTIKAPTTVRIIKPSGVKNLLTSLPFAPGLSEISNEGKLALNKIAEDFKASGKRIQIKAHAAQTGNSKNRARRLSLARALAVRAFLLDHGVSRRLVDVRAMGAPNDDGPDDRVDILSN